MRSEAATATQGIFLSNLPAGRAEQRAAFATVVASALIFLVLAPFAKLHLRPVPAFIPIYQSAQFINDLITAVVLFAQSRGMRSNALLLLAGGYVFTALMAVAHGLSFPGLFAPKGLLGASEQTTAWLYMIWHGGFPLFVIAYATYEPPPQSAHRYSAALFGAFALVLAAVCASTLLATRGIDLLPPIMQANGYAPAMIGVVSGVWALSLIAVMALSRRRPYTVLDVWLIVVMFAWLFDIALSAVLNAGRYDLGFYVGRIYGFVAASLVLAVLLVENSRLYLQLIGLRESDRAKAAELERLSIIDPLTGIANRRAFDDALGQEWRRMMRHQTPLSLLMIDVDYFKRFNDNYGHPAGDRCLCAVAQALAGQARRAGELTARYGGEEFAALLPQLEADDARNVAERMCAAVRALAIPHEGSAVAAYVTISVGIASVSDLPKSVAALCREGGTAAPPSAAVLVEVADQALYRAKTAGRNRVAAAGDEDAAIAPAPAKSLPSAA
jgi:diguanylate cyclase (GGDEF)-like protein